MKNSHNCLTALSLIIASSCIAVPVHAADQYGKSGIQESGTASVSGGNLPIGDDQSVTDRGSDNLYGGYAQITGSSGGKATVTDSKADLTNVTTSGAVAGGVSEINSGGGEGTVTGSTLTINGGTYGNAYGGCVTLGTDSPSGSGISQDNTVEIKNSTFGGWDDEDSYHVSGGYVSSSNSTQSISASASSNNVLLENITASGQLYVNGGKVDAGMSDTAKTATVKADKNTLYIAQNNTGAAKIRGVVGGEASVDYGGVVENDMEYIISASANGLEVINGSYSFIYGGSADLSGNGSATASNNGAYSYTDEDGTEVTHKGVLTNATVESFIGGAATGNIATASTNIFTLVKGSYGEVSGGYAYTVGNSDDDKATAQDNVITLTGSTASANVQGAFVYAEDGIGTATATGNMATMDDNAAGRSLEGAYVSGGIAVASFNTATIKNGSTCTALIGGEATGGTATASSNQAIFDNATFSTKRERLYTVCGGIATGGSTATAEKNTMYIVQTSESANKVQEVVGGVATVSSTNDGNNVVASANGVEMTNGSYGEIYGGLAESSGTGSATASNNGEYTYTEDGKTVTHNGVLKNVTADSFIGGEAATNQGTATALTNIFTMEQGSYGNVTGGKAGTGSAGTVTATGNEITFDNATLTGTLKVALAYVGSGTADASSNTATVRNGGTYKNLTGGEASVTGTNSTGSSATASSNHIIFDDAALSTGSNVYGGKTLVYGWSSNNSTATAEKNTLHIVQTSESANKAGNVFGGLAEVKNTNDGNNLVASANGIEMVYGTYTNIYGGQAVLSGTGTVTASNNGAYSYTDEDGKTVEHKGVLTNVTTDKFIGGYVEIFQGTATASTNIFTMEQGIYGDVRGGQATAKNSVGEATATGNEITFDNATVTGTLTVASASVNSGTADASSNTATVKNGGTYKNLTGGNATASAGTATASSNHVIFDDATISTGAVVYGGKALVSGTSSDTSTATAENNTLHIVQTSESANKAGNVFGGLAEVKSTKDGNNLAASANGIEMTNGTYTNIYGGQAVLSGNGTVTACNNGEYTYADEDEAEVTHKGELTNVTADQFVGGLAQSKGTSATASSNIFTLTNGTYTRAAGGKAEITAGSSSEDDVALAESNKLVLTNGTSEESFTGGIALVSGTGKAQVKGNEVELTESESGTVTGASASADGGSSYAYKNTVTIKGGTFSDVCGGSSAIETGTALSEDNKIILTGGTYTNLVGGRAMLLSADTDDASGQSDETALLMAADVPAVASLSDDVAVLAETDSDVMLLEDADSSPAVSDSTSGTEEESVSTVDVTGSKVDVTDGTVTGVTTGGLASAEGSGNATAWLNSVKLKETAEGASNYSGTVYGGRAVVAENGEAEAYQNTLELASGDYDNIYGGSAEVAGEGTAKVHDQNHEFNFASGKCGNLIAGNASVGNGQAEVSSNSLALQGGVYTGSVYAGKAAVSSAASAEDSASATGNKVTATDTAVSGDLHAGFAYVDGAGTATVSGNEMYLYGGQYDSNVSAGYIQATDETISATATDNTMVLGLGSDGTSSPVFNAQNSVLYGGYATTDGTTSIYANASNNTMRYEYVKGMTAANIRGFENLEFTLPSICADETVMTLTGGENNESTSIANATAKATVGKVYGKTGGALQIGDKIYLLKNANGLDSTDLTMLPVEYTDGPVISRKGALMAEGLVMETDENSLYLTTTEPDADSSGAKALSEGAAASFALASQAAESVIEVIRAVASQEWVVFGRINGAKSRYETGSSIDITTLSMVAGAGRGFDTGAGFLTVGAFFEYGTGSYTTHNSFETRSDVDGDGQSRYMGGGLMAKMDFKDTGPGHFHADASAHMGNLHNAFDSNDITDEFGRSATFDYDTPYYSVHGTLGYQWNITDSHELDLYGQYIWTKVEGADVDLSTGDIYKFDDMNSNRLRLGATYSYKGNSMFSPYIGAAWEHEFSGSCDATVSGLDVASPSFRGDTLRGELGIKTIASDDMPVTLNLGVQGYTGVRNGISADFYFRYDF